MKVRILIHREAEVTELADAVYDFPFPPQKGDFIECLDENSERIKVTIKELGWKAIFPDEPVLLLECEPKK